MDINSYNLILIGSCDSVKGFADSLREWQSYDYTITEIPSNRNGEGVDAFLRMVVEATHNKLSRLRGDYLSATRQFPECLILGQEIMAETPREYAEREAERLKELQRSRYLTITT